MDIRIGHKKKKHTKPERKEPREPEGRERF